MRWLVVAQLGVHCLLLMRVGLLLRDWTFLRDFRLESKIDRFFLLVEVAEARKRGHGNHGFLTARILQDIRIYFFCILVDNAMSIEAFVKLVQCTAVTHFQDCALHVSAGNSELLLRPRYWWFGRPVTKLRLRRWQYLWVRGIRWWIFIYIKRRANVTLVVFCDGAECADSDDWKVADQRRYLLLLWLQRASIFLMLRLQRLSCGVVFIKYDIFIFIIAITATPLTVHPAGASTNLIFSLHIRFLSDVIVNYRESSGGLLNMSRLVLLLICE